MCIGSDVISSEKVFSGKIEFFKALLFPLSIYLSIFASSISPYGLIC